MLRLLCIVAGMASVGMAGCSRSQPVAEGLFVISDARPLADVPDHDRATAFLKAHFTELGIQLRMHQGGQYEVTGRGFKAMSGGFTLGPGREISFNPDLLKELGAATEGEIKCEIDSSSTISCRDEYILIVFNRQ
jgi:hypothetical protein